MKILFLTIVKISDLNDRGIYTDFLRQFQKNGHEIFVACPSERRYKEKAGLSDETGFKLLKVKTLNLQKCNPFEKLIGLISLEFLFLRAIKRAFSCEKFDLIIYSTPPISFTSVIKYIKQRDHSISYLMLKDIFPQNAVDLGMMSSNGILYWYFRNKEKKLYKISDYIGCMSSANVDYILQNNSFLKPNSVEICPNTIEPSCIATLEGENFFIKRKYKIPENAVVCVYGGNLGKPQGISFLLEVLRVAKNDKRVFFIIVGNGTEYKKIQKWFDTHSPENSLLFSFLPKRDFDSLLSIADIGMIFLDPRFTIPNFPSRLLSYMEFSLPVITATDSSTDLPNVIEEGGFGFGVVSGDLGAFMSKLNYLILNEEIRRQMGRKARIFLEENYTAVNTYKIIINHFL